MASPRKQNLTHKNPKSLEDKKPMPKAVILAADPAEGLLESQKKYPKPLTPILGIPLLERLLKTLQRAGITQAIIVTGYLSHTIRKHLGDGSKLNIQIQYAYSRKYKQGNAISLKAARKYLPETEPFLLSTADTLVNSKIVKKVLSNINHMPLLCVDFKPRYSRQTKKATKVFVSKEGHIVDIGKDIHKRNGASAGILLLNNTIWNAIDRSEKNESPLTIAECLRQLIAEGSPLWACDVSNHFWFHIDTLEDVKFVEQLLSGFPKSREIA